MSNLTPDERRAIILAMENSAVISNCLNCYHWTTKAVPGGQCGKFKQVPPPNIIARSCNEWSHFIPF